MDRNTTVPFAMAQTSVDIGRSIFPRNSGHKTTLNTGSIIPIYIDPILPGDTVSMDMAAAIRMTTPIFPVMDNCYMDIYYFFVPNRLVWEHWEEFCGENKLTAWEQTTEYEIPQIEAPDTTGWIKGTIADYMGIPTGVTGISVSHLPFRAYCKIWNDWFRDENNKDATMYNTDETTLTGVNTGNYVTDAQLGGLPLKAAKSHDYFTSALPEPQKGPDVSIPLAQGAIFPVVSGPVTPLERYPKDPITGNLYAMGYYDCVNKDTKPTGAMYTEGNGAAIVDKSKNPSSNTAYVTPSNLAALWDGQIQSASINQLRQAFAVQRFYEKQARGGTRYTEIVKSHFGVTSSDARLQRSEYLGGDRIYINVDQVLQTSATDAVTPQGNVAAYSLTNMAGSMFTKSFTEHGYLLGLAVIRTKHTYQQGIERFWSAKSKFDMYWPVFANLGEQAILNKEIFAQGSSVVDSDGNVVDEQAFGYQEAWADYRYKPDRVSGLFRSNVTGTLDSWHYADYYESLPILGEDWIDETTANVQRTLAVQDEDQFICDFYFRANYSRTMPINSVPGLIDHH